MTDIFTLLKSHEFFRGLPDEDIQLFTKGAELTDFEPRQVLLRYQQPADEFWVLLEGQVVILNHVPGSRIRPVETITAPSVVGWSWLLPPYRWHFDVKAQSSGKAIRIDAATLRKNIEQDSAFASRVYPRFLTLVVDRLQAARLQGLDIYSTQKGGLRELKNM